MDWWVKAFQNLSSHEEHANKGRSLDVAQHIRPYPLENTGSRPLSPSQASESQISSWVGDDQRIPGVVCFFGTPIDAFCPVLLFVDLPRMRTLISMLQRSLRHSFTYACRPA